jgi:hypothetical protein
MKPSRKEHHLARGLLRPTQETESTGKMINGIHVDRENISMLKTTPFKPVKVRSVMSWTELGNGFACYDPQNQGEGQHQEDANLL